MTDLGNEGADPGNPIPVPLLEFQPREDNAPVAPAHVLQGIDADYCTKLVTWARFIHLVRWFAAHALVDLAGIYFLVATDSAATGIFLIAVGTALFIRAIFTQPRTVERKTALEDPAYVAPTVYH